ncbi:hypothetical protein VSH64_35910 [Amycolatopsis rhabdoformis]|uniref:Flp pilus assembly protein CpaB n=1 Tax=Amycolatopsis rhabdoformis TaxID=1448059 RepID=A0ABZ1I2Y5_9PSEU|nr:hypothetical protein [Amycolatopsis rhabdoformis]WSE28188.1 hypothetical protein VSH64_35910 [Amycolatopsis rhabdoformis]
MRKIENRLLAAVLAGAVGAFVVTASLGLASRPEVTPPAPVAVVQVTVPAGDLRLTEPVLVRDEGSHRAARPVAAARPA